MKNTIIIFLCLWVNIFLINAQELKKQKIINLKNTIWVYDYGGGIKDTISFKNNDNYIFYSAELGEYFCGTYCIQKNTIILKNKNKENNKSHSKVICNDSVSGLMNLTLRDNQLGFIANWDVEKKEWKEDYYLTKIE